MKITASITTESKGKTVTESATVEIPQLEKVSIETDFEAFRAQQQEFIRKTSLSLLDAVQAKLERKSK